MTMKFLIIGDLHGKMPNFYYKNFDAIIAPGDFCSTDAMKKYMFQALKKNMQNPNSRVEWYDIIGKRKAKQLIKKSLSDGRKILEKLNSLNIPVYTVPGNADWAEEDLYPWDYLRQNHFKKLTKGLTNIIDVHQRIIDIGEYQIIGYGISWGPEYPQYEEDLKKFKPEKLKKRKKTYEKRMKKLTSLFEKATKPVIFISHNVPFNTKIDKIINKDSPRNGYHNGSIITRELIEKYQPVVCIGGHIHEHFAKCKIKKTTAINAGYGPNVNVWLELSKEKIKKIEFHKEK